MKAGWITLIIFAVIGLLTLGPFLVMTIWNFVMVELIDGLHEITFWESLLLIIMCSILTGIRFNSSSNN